MENFFKDINFNNIDINEIKIKTEKIKEASKMLTEVLMEISILDDTLTDVDKELKELENRVFHLRLITEKIMKGRVELTEGNENLEQAFHDMTIHEDNVRKNACGYNNFVRLPKIELSTFSGLYEDWYVFYDMFNSLIHSNNSRDSLKKPM